jgi:hypothetical protein
MVRKNEVVWVEDVVLVQWRQVGGKNEAVRAKGTVQWQYFLDQESNCSTGVLRCR